MNRRTLLSLVLLVVLFASCDKRHISFRQKNLNGACVGVLASSMQENQAKELWPNGQYRAYPTNIDALNALRHGEVEAVYLDELVVYNKQYSKKLFEIAFIENDHLPIAGAFRQSDTFMANKFAEFLRVIKSNGIFVRMKNRWTMSENIDTITPVRLVKDFNKKTLVVGIIGEMRPYSLMNKGQWTGFENELWALFADYLGYNIQYEVYDFAELLPALLEKKVDVIAAAITVTEERERKVLFSKPYSHSCSVCLVKK